MPRDESFTIPSLEGSTGILHFDTYSGDKYVDVHWKTGLRYDFGDMLGNLDSCILNGGIVDLLMSEVGPNEGFVRVQRSEQIGKDSLRATDLINNKLYYFRLLTYCAGDSLVGISEPLMTSPGVQPEEIAQIPANQADPPIYLNVMDWSFDGAEIAYIKSSQGSGSDIYLYNVHSQESRQITYFSGSHRLMGVDFQPNGPDLLYNYSPTRTAGRIDYRVWHLPTPYETSNAVPITAGRVDDDGVWATDSSIFYAKGTHGSPNIPLIHHLTIGESDVGNVLLEMDGMRQYDPTISEDGTMIAFYSAGAIYIAELPEAPDISMVIGREFGWENMLPKWMTNENNVLLFSTDRSGHFELWRLDLATSELEQLTRSQKGDEVFGGIFDPGGEYLLYHSMSGVREGTLVISRIP